MIIRRKSTRMGVVAGIVAIATIGGPIITHYIDKSHEDTKLKEMHEHDLKEADQKHLHSTHGYRVMIDEMKQEIKILRQELEIAKGALGASENSNLELVEKIMKLEKKIKQKETLLAFYIGH